jgi:non-ribosomal peptide synthetase component F
VETGLLGSTIPIGRPLANRCTYVLDGDGQPLLIGVAGELFVGGIGVARGYLNRTELTAERFLPDPFAVPVQRARRPPQQSTPDRLTLRGQGIGGLS